MHEIMEALLDGEAANGRNDGIALRLEALEIAVGVFIEEIVIGVIVFVEGIINDVDFGKGNVVFIVDDAFGSFGNGDDFIGEH